MQGHAYAATNISVTYSSVRKQVEVEIAANRITNTMFDKAADEIKMMMSKDNFARYKKGDLFKKYASNRVSLKKDTKRPSNVVVTSIDDNNDPNVLQAASNYSLPRTNLKFFGEARRGNSSTACVTVELHMKPSM